MNFRTETLLVATFVALVGCSSGAEPGMDAGLLDGAALDSPPDTGALDASHVSEADVLVADPSTQNERSLGRQIVGPAGGRLVYEMGVTLDIPPDAVTESIEVEAIALPITHTRDSGSASAPVMSLQLKPSGLVFDRPVLLTMPIASGSLPSGSAVVSRDEFGQESPSEPRYARRSATSLRPDPRFDAVTDWEEFASGDDVEPTVDHDQLEVLKVVAASSSAITVELRHFSIVDVLESTPPAMTLRGLTNCGSASADTLVVSEQLFRVWRSASAALSAIPESDTRLRPPPFGAFLAPRALDDLKLASAEVPLSVGYAVRSLATQYVVARTCSAVSAAAPIGASAHGAGEAIDLALPLKALQAKCTAMRDQNASRFAIMEAVLPPNLGRALLQNNWVWWGLFVRRENMCKDPVHFEHRAFAKGYPRLADIVGPNAQQLRAFEQIWSRSYPCAPIANSAGIPIVPGTEAHDALSATPRVGFPAAAEKGTIALGEQGTAGVGCDASEVCCSAKGTHGTPWCAREPDRCSTSDEDCGAYGYVCFGSDARRNCLIGRNVSSIGISFIYDGLHSDNGRRDGQSPIAPRDATFTNWCPFQAVAPNTPAPDRMQTSIQNVAPACGEHTLVIEAHELEVREGEYCDPPSWPVTISFRGLQWTSGTSVRVRVLDSSDTEVTAYTFAGPGSRTYRVVYEYPSRAGAGPAASARRP